MNCAIVPMTTILEEFASPASRQQKPGNRGQAGQPRAS